MLISFPLLVPKLCLEGNPLFFHPSHRVATTQYLSPRAKDAAHSVSDPLSSTLVFLSCPVLLLYLLTIPG